MNNILYITFSSFGNKKIKFNLILLVLSFFIFSFKCFSLEDPKVNLEKVSITTKLGTKTNLDLKFTNIDNKELTLKEIFSGDKPIIFTPVYYECPRVCGLLLQAVVKLINEMDLEIGKDFKVVTISFDPSEGIELAKKKSNLFKNQIVNFNNRNQFNIDWNFLTGNKENIDTLMKQVGFNYFPDDTEFAHSPAILILSANGVISQYFTDINFSASDVRLSLIQASEGKIGSPFDHFLLFCYRFDPTKGKYSIAAWNFLRFSSVLCVIIIAFVVYMQIRKKIV